MNFFLDKKTRQKYSEIYEDVERDGPREVRLECRHIGFFMESDECERI